MRGVGRAVTALRASPTRQWWMTFALASLLTGLWAFASPLFSGPDEPAHTTHAAAVARGEWTGDEPDDRDASRGALEVTVPRVFATNPACFAFHAEIPAGCLVLAPEGDREVLTSAGRHPPAYYALVGMATRWLPPGSASVYVMRLVGALATSAFAASAVVTLRRVAEPRLAACGLLVAITPMVLFVSVVVNPSATEVAAGLGLWVTGAVLVLQPRDRVPPLLVTGAGVAASVLVVSRQLGPMWLVLIGACLVGLGSRPGLGRIFRDARARVWAAVVAVLGLAQLGWLTAVSPLNSSLSQDAGLRGTASVVRRTVIGRGYSNFLQMIGVFGWLDAPAPALTWLLWTGALGALAVLALAFGSRRIVAVMGTAAVFTVLVPAVLEGREADVAGLFWQGRYTLPLAVGVPILAGLAMATSEHRRVLARSALLPAVGVTVVAAHVLAFAQALRRYTVGYDGQLQYWKGSQWIDGWKVVALSLTFVTVIVAFVVWLLHPGDESRVGGDPPVRTMTAVGTAPRASS